jgi:hypothetical protein
MDFRTLSPQWRRDIGRRRVVERMHDLRIPCPYVPSLLGSEQELLEIVRLTRTKHEFMPHA